MLTVRPNVYESPTIEKNELPASDAKTVVLYSAEWCGYCRKARDYFRANDIPFEEYDVETSRKGKRDYERFTAKGVLVILIGKKRLNGFSVSSFRNLYGPQPSGA